MGTCQEGNKLSSTMKPNSYRGHISTSIVIIKRKTGRSLPPSETPQKIIIDTELHKTSCLSDRPVQFMIHTVESLPT